MSQQLIQEVREVREALARAEAGRDYAHRNAAIIANGLLDRIDKSDRLAEAVGLLRKARYLTGYDLAIDDFLARHAKAEQQEAQYISVQDAWEAAGGNPGIKADREQLLFALNTLDKVCDEAQGAQAGDERAEFYKWFNDYSLAVRMNGGVMNDAQMFDAWKARAALATQPAAGDPVKLQHMAVAEDGELRWMTGRKVQNCELYAMPDFGLAPALYTDSPAAAHGAGE